MVKQVEFMKTNVLLLAICTAGMVLVGCSTIKSAQTDTTRVITITQSSQTQYCLRINETTRTAHGEESRHALQALGGSESVTYPEVEASVDGKTETVEIRNPGGTVVVSISFAVKSKKGVLLAVYELKRLKEDGAMDCIAGDIKIR